MIDESYITRHQESSALRYVDILLGRVDKFVSSTSNSNLMDEFVFKKSMIVDISFACELLIKVLLLRQGISSETFNSHNLNINFNLLDSTTQQEIKGLVSDVDFDSKLSNPDTSSTYENSRYIYESNTGNPDYVFLSKLCKALYKKVNNRELEYSLIDSNMSQGDYDSIDRSNDKSLLIKKTLDLLLLKINYLNSLPLTSEIEEYLIKNMTSCDMALFCELLFKKYVTRNVQSHEYKELYKKLSDAVEFMFAKGIYSDYATNSDDRYTLYYSEESFLYPDSFTKVNSAEKENILRKLDGIFTESRYACFKYFDKYVEMLKFYNISTGIYTFIDGNEDKVNKLMEFRKIVDNGEWYGFTVEDILSLDIEYLKKLNEIFRNNGSYRSILSYRNLIYVKDENKEKVINLLANNFSKYQVLLEEIDDSTIDYFINDTKYVDGIIDYINSDWNQSIFIKSKYSDIGYEYVYNLINVDVIKSNPSLLASIINNGEQIDINRIIRIISIVLNNKSINEQVKLMIVNNIGSIAGYPDERLGQVIAMLSYVFSSYNDEILGGFENKEFLDRNIEDIHELIYYYKRYSVRISKEKYLEYLSKADPFLLKIMENKGLFRSLSGLVDFSLFADKDVTLKIIQYLSHYPSINIEQLEIFKSDLSIEEIYRIVFQNYDPHVFRYSADSYEQISSQLKTNDLLKEFFKKYPAFRTYEVLRYIPNYLLENDCKLLNIYIRNNYYFNNYGNYNSSDIIFIVNYYGRLFRAKSKGILNDDFERFFDISSMVLYREHPEILDRINPKDYSYYTVASVNSIYERLLRIKTGEITFDGNDNVQEDIQKCIDLFLKYLQFDPNDVKRIDELFGDFHGEVRDGVPCLVLGDFSKKIIKNVSETVMELGNRRTLEGKSRDFKRHKLLKECNGTASIYDVISVIFSYEDPDEDYDLIKDYINYLDTLYPNKALRPKLINHLSILLNIYKSWLPYNFYKVIREFKEYMINNPDKIESLLDDFNLYLKEKNDYAFDRFVNQELVLKLKDPQDDVEFADYIPPEVISVDNGYEVVEERYKSSIIDRAKSKLNIMKLFVQKNIDGLILYLRSSLYNSELMDIYLDVKRYFIKLSKVHEIKFALIEKSINKSLEGEDSYGRRK